MKCCDVIIKGKWKEKVQRKPLGKRYYNRYIYLWDILSFFKRFPFPPLFTSFLLEWFHYMLFLKAFRLCHANRKCKREFAIDHTKSYLSHKIYKLPDFGRWIADLNFKKFCLVNIHPNFLKIKCNFSHFGQFFHRFLKNISKIRDKFNISSNYPFLCKILTSYKPVHHTSLI